MTHKTCVARQTCNIFIRWPYLTWPWPLLTIGPILTRNLLQPLRSLWGKFGFAAIISHISVADKSKSDRFDIWPDLDLAYDLFKKFKKISESTHWEISIATSPASLRLLVRELAGGGNNIYPPPPRAPRSAGDPSAARVNWGGLHFTFRHFTVNIYFVPPKIFRN